MLNVLVLVLFVCAVKCELNPILTHRGVVGGTIILGPHPHKHQVSIRKSDKHSCGGSVISSRVIVTAAHCVYTTSVSLLSVAIGITSQRDSCKPYIDLTIVVHEHYNHNYKYNDIALIITKKNIEFNNRIQPIKLHESIIEAGTDCTATGWGGITHEGPLSFDLRELKTMSISTADCNRRYGHINPEMHLCTLKCVGQGVCMGDSGGPLTYNGELIGVISFGQKCASGVPDVFVRISSYIKWIKEMATKHNCNF